MEVAISDVDTNLKRGPYTDPVILSRIGVKHIICLQTPEDRILEGPYSEDELADTFKMTVTHLPLSDIWFPDDTRLKQILGAIEWYRSNVLTFVQCTHGVDRTGIVCALHRVVYQAWTQEAAFAEMENIGFHNFPYFWWKPLLRDAMTRLKIAS